MDSGKTYRLVIIESSEVVRAGLERIFADNACFKVVAAVDEPARCIERISVLKPDVILLNPLLVESNSRSTLRGIFPEFAGARIVAFVSGLFSDRILRQYDGIASIHDSASQIMKKIHKALESASSAPSADGYELSEREREILVSVARGLTNKEIADMHHISIYTVITHRKNITRKTGIKSVAGLTVYALLNNMIDQSDMQ